MSRKLDAAIAEALGETVARVDYEKYLKYVIPGNKSEQQRDLPCYSTNGNAMLELEREMSWRGWFIRSMMIFIDDIFIGYSLIEDDEMVRMVVAQANTEPLARALAAYKALTGEEWSE